MPIVQESPKEVDTVLKISQPMQAQAQTQTQINNNFENHQNLHYQMY